jgi:hypothetical protein
LCGGNFDGKKKIDEEAKQRIGGKAILCSQIGVYILGGGG